MKKRGRDKENNLAKQELRSKRAIFPLRQSSKATLTIKNQIKLPVIGKQNLQKMISPSRVLTEPILKNQDQKVEKGDMRKIMGTIIDYHKHCTIETQIKKLQHLANNHSFLRRDLAEIQRDVLTLSLKRLLFQNQGQSI